ncbi:uncharacterized protein DUF4231 [Halopolyspora algeriensis]|uniref:Uncharacterized protein DUF4231 n=1 Tax=Halopolyspora algeriensis TaxID=1500506 RepID=A0A368VG87_9ACTN|nr:DUF4231 domain-containing protein [Halopolyspora algeriensis]RCW40187.1 uncharacterized protein DUF4231 [Halopolyspora algeriensis]TQM46331.1 uncharacterized protein DUF4231 [Halopolyspora algeriensis]
MGSAEASTGIIGGGVISGESHPDDIQLRLGERTEQLHRAKLLQRFLLMWAFPGNVVLFAASLGCFTVLPEPPFWLLVSAVVVPIGSVVVSARMLYRRHFTIRALETQLRELHRAHREQLLEDLGAGDLLAAQKRYRLFLPETVEQYRIEARRHRRAYNALQAVIIGGSIIASVIVAASVSFPNARWPAVGMSLLVAVTAAFAGYSRYRERGINLQQTADALEREYHSVELRVGKYRRFEDERAAYTEFAHEVEALREEHAKRQQQVGQAGVPDVVM